MLDSLIIGGGPAGLAVANTFARAGVSYRVIEKGQIGHHVSQYPTFMRFYSTRDLLEIDGFPLTITDEKPSRRQYLMYLTRFAKDRRLSIRTYTDVRGVQRRTDGGFDVRTRAQSGAEETIPAASVVVACGAFAGPRTLGVPGEELAKVSSRYTEAHPYVGHKVLIVGGRNSAAEVALELWRAGVDVSLSYRGTELRGIKYWLRPDLENRLKNGEIRGHLGTTVKRIDWDSVTLENDDGGETVIENDFVLTLIGHNPPVDFLRSMGIELEPETNIPHHDPETLETNVPGLFVAGVITNGNVSGKVFIENSRHHGELIVPQLKELVQG